MIHYYYYYYYQQLYWNYIDGKISPENVKFSVKIFQPHITKVKCLKTAILHLSQCKCAFSNGCYWLSSSDLYKYRASFLDFILHAVGLWLLRPTAIAVSLVMLVLTIQLTHLIVHVCSQMVSIFYLWSVWKVNKSLSSLFIHPFSIVLSCLRKLKLLSVCDTIIIFW